MAKKRMTLEEALNISAQDFNRLTRVELSQVVRVLADAGNKRINRLVAREKAGEGTSPALRTIRKKGKFSTKDKTLQQLRSEYARAKHFLNLETSTVKGIKKIEKKAQTRFNNLNRKQINKLWDVWGKLQENKKFIDYYQSVLPSDLVQKVIAKHISLNNKKSVDEILDDILRDLDEEYRKRIDEFSVISETEPFDIGGNDNDSVSQINRNSFS